MIIDKVNLFGDISNIKQILFDTVHPIGETYVQYPQEDDPNTLYKQDAAISCEWIEVVKYNGCFFRSTNAPITFYCREGETDYYRDVALTKPIDVSGLGSVTVVSTTGGISTCRGNWTSGNANDYIDETGVLSLQSQSTAVNGLSLSKSGGAYGNRQTEGGSVSIYLGRNGSSTHPINGISSGEYEITSSPYGEGTWCSGSCSTTFTPSVSDNISYSINGDSETRPDNYSIKIWKRIS